MIGFILFSVMGVFLIGWLLRAWVDKARSFKRDEWRHVPPPNWRSCRGGREIW
jgi:hypothetical protein